MPSMLKRGSFVALLLFTVVAWGCESSTEPAPEAPSMQVVDGGEDRLLGGLIGAVLNTGLSLVQTTVTIVGDAGDLVIGPVGGLLRVDNHQISVPPGAVPHPTQFSMTVLSGTTIEVDLLAVDPETGDDVGGKGFTRPVQLALSYADAKLSRRDIDRLVIVRIHEDGRREPLPSVIDRENQRVIAELDHFSKYGLCRN